ncbi:MAG TPA: hypothetical protein VLG76_02505 [Rhabdochlamydiaceae bacterium]|nr:hypothetical protein [Rhabdochlamydiaceae bacterium]
MSSIHRIRIGAEEYVPDLPPTKGVIQEVGQKHRVINFSKYIAMPYSKCASKAYLDVEVEDGSGTYQYRVDSAKLAQALRLPNPQAVAELSRESKLVQKIREVTIEAEKEKEKVINKELKRFYRAYPDSAEAKKALGVIADLMESVIRVAVGKFYASSLPEYNRQLHYYFIRKKTLAIVLKEQNGLRVVCLERYLGDGSTAVVFKVKSVLDRMDLALKVAWPNDRAQQWINREFETYTQLYGNLPPGAHITGLQMNCYRKLDGLPLKVEGEKATIDRQNLTCGLLLPLYSFGSLYSFVLKNEAALNIHHLKNEWREDGCYQLLLGASHLETQGKVNTDTCILNTFVTEGNERGFLQYDLGDLESVISFKTYQKSFPIFHSNFVRLSEINLMIDCLKDPKLFEQHMEKVAPKAAAFSLTTVLLEVLTHQLTLAFYLKSNGRSLYPDLARGKTITPWDRLERDNKELASLFEHALFDPNDRYTPKHLLEKFHSIMELQNPELHQKYDQRVKALLQGKSKEPVEEKGEEPNSSI